jgi:hypothetical protein
VDVIVVQMTVLLLVALSVTEKLENVFLKRLLHMDFVKDVYKING